MCVCVYYLDVYMCYINLAANENISPEDQRPEGNIFSKPAFIFPSPLWLCFISHSGCLFVLFVCSLFLRLLLAC